MQLIKKEGVIALYEGEKFYAIVNTLFEPLKDKAMRVGLDRAPIIIDFVMVDNKLYAYIWWLPKYLGVNAVMDFFTREARLWNSSNAQIEYVKKRVKEYASLLKAGVQG